MSIQLILERLNATKVNVIDGFYTGCATYMCVTDLKIVYLGKFIKRYTDSVEFELDFTSFEDGTYYQIENFKVQLNSIVSEEGRDIIVDIKSKKKGFTITNYLDQPSSGNIRENKYFRYNVHGLYILGIKPLIPPNSSVEEGREGDIGEIGEDLEGVTIDDI